MPRALERLEQHFGKIPEEKRSMIQKLTKSALLLRQLSRKVIIQKEYREGGERLHFFIPKTKKENHVDALVRPFFDKKELCYELKLLSLGTLKKGAIESVNKGATGKFNGLGKLLMTVIIAHAKRNGTKRIDVECAYHLINFYNKFGFKVIADNNESTGVMMELKL